MNSSETVESLCAAADKKLRGGFLSLFSGGPQYDDAADLYIQAGNRCKMNKKWPEATECFKKAVWAYEKAKDSTRQASTLVEAGHVAKKYSSATATELYEAAANIYTTSGRFGQSAKLMKTIAEMYQTEGDELNAMAYYKRAADYFEMDEFGKSQYSSCILQYAELSARLEGQYQKPIKIFEEEAEKALRNSLIQFNAKDHLLKAGILRLVLADVADMKISLQKYNDMDPRFQTSREGKLLSTLIDAYDKEDDNAFSIAIQEYDNITRLDGWKVHFLYKVGEAMKRGNSGGLDSLATEIEFKADGSAGKEIDLS